MNSQFKKRPVEPSSDVVKVGSCTPCRGTSFILSLYIMLDNLALLEAHEACDGNGTAACTRCVKNKTENLCVYEPMYDGLAHECGEELTISPVRHADQERRVLQRLSERRTWMLQGTAE